MKRGLFILPLKRQPIVVYDDRNWVFNMESCNFHFNK